MSNHTHAVNGSQNHDSVKAEKPARIAKEPAATQSMAYEPNPIQKHNGSSSGTTNHTSYSMNQRKTLYSLKVFNITTDLDIGRRLSIIFKYP